MGKHLSGRSQSEVGSSNGFTVAICTHDGAQRLPRVLEAVGELDVTGLTLDVLVIDNASSDDTSATALAWSERIPSLRVLREDRIGLTHARERAFAEAREPLLAFLDDDNIPRSDFLQVANRVLTDNIDVVAVGGDAIAAWDPLPEPNWFQPNSRYFACGPQGSQRGPLTDPRAFLRGAGLVVRVDAWRLLQNHGFRPRLVGRAGGVLSSGEDIEICLALRLAGGTLYYEPNLVLHHVMPATRARWEYLVNIQRGNGASSVLLDAYWTAVGARPAKPWWWRTGGSLTSLAKSAARAILQRRAMGEDLAIASSISRLRNLVATRRASDVLADELIAAPYRGVLRPRSWRIDVEEPPE